MKEERGREGKRQGRRKRGKKEVCGMVYIILSIFVFSVF